ncbi:MAG: bifunctional phosphopantothenoylcysteine decarboxylase/phosphopantothenate--cysteine ligase CoaBC [Chitinophagaceae bacterium]
MQGKRILLAITGSIAAYKSILLVRLLVKQGAEIKVVLTPAAKDFVSPLVLATLTKNTVLDNLSTGDTWANHVMLGRWADIMMVAPLSCNTLSKMATGLCDNLLMAVYLSATCPVLAVPAMDEDMWYHATTQRNIETIKANGNMVMDVGIGELASGLTGLGRMAEPDEIVRCLERYFFAEKPLKGKKAMVTAGPTYEPLDPVRFIGNHSSGKMGISIANELLIQGAEVTLILGPVSLQANTGIKTIRIQTAEEMYLETMRIFPEMDIAVMAAAVADYRPATVELSKIKKTGDTMTLELVKNPDILKSCGVIKKDFQLLAGFALETDNEEANAREKLEKKNADLIILNSMKDEGGTFKSNQNKISIFDKNGHMERFEMLSKQEVAQNIVSYLVNKMAER